MKRSLVLLRTRARRSDAGFTLIELMVVVVLIAVLAALASPSMASARNDAILFDHARQWQQIVMQARSRAAGTGAAHLVVMGPGGGTRGAIWMYQAQEPNPPAGRQGPEPVSSCRLAGQWAEANQATAKVDGTRAVFVPTWDNMNDVKGVVVDMDLTAKLTFNASSAAAASVTYLVVCVTPAGTTYVFGDNNLTTAINGVQTSAPFMGFAMAEFVRHNTSGVAVGLKRQVILSGGGNPRLRSL